MQTSVFFSFPRAVSGGPGAICRKNVCPCFPFPLGFPLPCLLYSWSALFRARSVPGLSYHCPPLHGSSSDQTIELCFLRWRTELSTSASTYIAEHASSGQPDSSKPSFALNSSTTGTTFLWPLSSAVTSKKDKNWAGWWKRICSFSKGRWQHMPKQGHPERLDGSFSQPDARGTIAGSRATLLHSPIYLEGYEPF